MAHRCTRSQPDDPERFERAASLDPGLAAAHLRVALTTIYHVLPATREHLRQAALLGASLGPRDQALLDGLEPVILHQPADWKEAGRRLGRAVERFPDDISLRFAQIRVASILDRVRQGVVVGDGGYLLELERRGYVDSGSDREKVGTGKGSGQFTPEVAIENPDALRGLHREVAGFPCRPAPAVPRPGAVLLLPGRTL